MTEETLHSRIAFDGRAVKLRVDTVRTSDGRETTREIVEHGECVAVVAVTEEDRVLLVRQYRTPLACDLLEIPAGGIEPGENPEETARREMQEETVFFPQNVLPLGGFYSSPGYCNEYLHLFLATGLMPRRLHAEDTDSIEIVSVPVADIACLVSSGEIRDAKSIAGLLTYLEYRQRQPSG